MSLTRDMTDDEFETLSVTKKKRYVAKLLIDRSGAKSVPESKMPLAIVMAGVPGAGKTEFLDTFSELFKARGFDAFIRIDLDEIVEIYPGYTPKTDAQFRSQGNHVVAAAVDNAKDGRYNMMIDGTFSGTSGASLQNIDRLPQGGYGKIPVKPQLRTIYSAIVVQKELRDKNYVVVNDEAAVGRVLNTGYNIDEIKEI